MTEEQPSTDSSDPQPPQDGATPGGWPERPRLWPVRAAWRSRLPRTWPSLLRLMAALLLLGGCVGLVSFLTRGVAAQNILPYAMPGVLRHALPTISVGPGTPTPDVYCCDDPFTPPPQSKPTATPTKTKPTATVTLTPSQPTATTEPGQFQVALAPTQAQCESPTAQLPPVTLTLDNSRGSVEVTWTLVLGPGPSGVGSWAQAVPATQGTLPAGAPPQPVTLIPDPSLCHQLFVKGKSGHFTAQVTTTPGGQTSTQIFTGIPATLSGGPTPTPSPSVTASPATSTPSPTSGA